MKGSLAGRVAVVTGASSGIGLATAKALAEAGAQLVLVSRSLARLEAAALEVTRAAGGGAPSLLVPCDVSDPKAVLAMADRVRCEVGTPGAMPELQGVFLSFVGKRIQRRERSRAKPPRGAG